VSQQHTPGPWRFEINEKSKTVNLCGGKPRYDLTVIDFKRWGMTNAQPRFRNADCLMQPVSDFAVESPGREHHADWFKVVNHPDARLIESSPELLDSVESLFELLCESITHGMPVTEQVASARNAAAELLRRNGRTEKMGGAK
jgi:hypothetical protein